MQGMVRLPFTQRQDVVPALFGRQMEAMHGSQCAAGEDLAEQIFGLLEEALGNGIHPLVAEFREFLQLGLLRAVQAGRHFSTVTPHMQISRAKPLEYF